MAITIAEAARQWRVARETIYRRQLAGELEFATIDPPTVDASEMLRAFGEPKAAADKPAATDVVALTRIEAICEALKAAAEYLMAELATMKKELQAEHEQTRKERDRLLEFLGVQKRLLETSETSTSPAAGRDVTIAARRNGGGAGGACRSATRRDPPDKMKKQTITAPSASVTVAKVRLNQISASAACQKSTIAAGVQSKLNLRSQSTISLGERLAGTGAEQGRGRWDRLQACS